MDVLFVTSFTEELYAASGRRLVESFCDIQKTGKLLVCTEGFKLDKPEIEHQHDLSTDPFLRTWLAANKDVIPDYLGGIARECACPDRHKRHGRHKRRCHWQWMNRNASRWFRKVAALRHAVMTYKTKTLVWLDSDCMFVETMPERFMEQCLSNTAMAYFRGHRPAIESGILLFDTSRPDRGKVVIERVCEKYVTKKYTKYERWDDGFIFTKVVEENARPPCRDLVHPTKWKGKTNDVIPTTDMHKYVHHMKGLHGTGLGLMQ